MADTSNKQKGVYLEGSLMRHIVVMTGASATGLFAIFASDLINIFYLSRLGQVEISAAAGYAATFFFFLISVGIGLAIAAVAFVAPALGAGDKVRANRLSVNAHIVTFGLSAILCAAVWPFIGPLLAQLGASGKTHDYAASFLQIALPSVPFLTTGMTSGAVLRSAGDARLSMWVTLSGALVTMALDPIFIFLFGLGIEGAAIASSIARFIIMAVGLRAVGRRHGLLDFAHAGGFIADALALGAVAAPAVLTNLATPFANAYVTQAIAAFADEAVAGWTIISRLLPVAFVGVFAMTGAVGPILGQNLGAKNFARVRGVIVEGLKFAAVYTVGAWILLLIVYPVMASLMKVPEQGRELLAFFCIWLAPLFGFTGALFVANAGFNTMRKPQFAAALNWSRATLGTVPLVMIGANVAAAKGVLTGQMAGGVVFGVLGVLACFRTIRSVERSVSPDPVAPPKQAPSPPLTPSSAPAT